MRPCFLSGALAVVAESKAGPRGRLSDDGFLQIVYLPAQCMVGPARVQSGDTSVKSVPPSIFPVVLGVGLRSSGLCNKRFYLLSHLTGPECV